MELKELVSSLTLALKEYDIDHKNILIEMVRDVLEGKTLSVSLPLKSVPAVVNPLGADLKDLLEVDETGKAHYLHSPNCEGACEYDCMGDMGFRWAEQYNEQVVG